jgi:hypothetical protein
MATPNWLDFEINGIGTLTLELETGKSDTLQYAITDAGLNNPSFELTFDSSSPQTAPISSLAITPGRIDIALVGASSAPLKMRIWLSGTADQPRLLPTFGTGSVNMAMNGANPQPLQNGFSVPLAD